MKINREINRWWTNVAKKKIYERERHGPRKNFIYPSGRAWDPTSRWGETNKHFDDLAPIQRMIDATSRNHFLFASIRVSRVSRVDLESRRVVASPVLVGALSVVVRRDQQKLPKRERRGEERKRIERERRGWGEE